MNTQATVALSSSVGIARCWKKIGVHGDSSCAELHAYVHCRNCPVYSRSAAEFLERPLPDDYLAEGTRHVAQIKQSKEVGTISVVVFRIGAEWLALATEVCIEILAHRPIHSLPHRRNGVVLGVANIRGELVVCVSLTKVLGLHDHDAKRTAAQADAALQRRLLVIQLNGNRVICPVDEVFGIVRAGSQELREVPASLRKAAATYTKCVLPWQNKAVGVLDEQFLLQTLTRSFSSAT